MEIEVVITAFLRVLLDWFCRLLFELFLCVLGALCGEIFFSFFPPLTPLLSSTKLKIRRTHFTAENAELAEKDPKLKMES